MDIKKELNNLSSKSLKNFNEKIIPATLPVYGVRVPDLRILAKKIATEQGLNFFDNNPQDYFEEIMLEGMVIGYIKTDLNTRIKLLDNFVGKITDWAVCDCSIATYSFTKKHLDFMWEYVCKKFESNKQFEKRFAIVMMLDYFIIEDYIDFVLDKLKNCVSEHYYVNMATAWALSVCFIKFRNKTLNMLEHCGLDKFTFNKTISKCCDSFRVSLEDKIFLKTLKKS